IMLTNPSGTTDINICVSSDQPFSLNQWPENETVTFQIDSLVVESNKTCVFSLNTNFDFETLPPLEFDINPVLCDKDTFSIGGEIFTQSRSTGSVKVFSNDDISCDTIYKVNVSFYPPAMGTFEATYCDETKIKDIGGTIFSINYPEGPAILENESVNGCDSLVIVKLNFTSFEAYDTLTYGCDIEDIKFTIESASHLGPYDISVNGTIQAPVLSLPYTTSLLPGINTIIVANMEGCEETINLLVEDVTIPEVILSQQANLDGTSQLIVVASNSIYDLNWSPASTLSCSDCTDPLALPLVTTTYTLSYLYGDDCNDSKQITVEVKEIVTDLPNIFSPNGDGSNDVFKILLSPEMKQITQFSIYDRWGSKVFSQSNIIDDANNNGWDGSYNGNFVSPGVYVYFYEIEYFSGKVETFSNTLTLIK
ncbi:MAG TPA: gliding motility-associated C-terminal domain-containing protein, partial [Saprospiraceae bacterium]|nr:gliding motility-associated C-terminal domain-containing protein [Saprospiraceae bacterium]